MSTPNLNNLPAWEASRVNEQVYAWENLAGKWASDPSIEAEIEAFYAARTEVRDVPVLRRRRFV